MYKKVVVFVSVFSMLWIFSGCTPGTVPGPQGTSQKTPNWGDESSPDDVDIDDLEENLTEERTTITEEMPDEKHPRIAFPVSEYNRLARTGKGTIEGAIYVKNLYDEKVTGSGTRLYLNPATSYSDQWYRDSYIGGRKLEKADARIYNYIRFTAANNNGKFAFYGVPSGSYYLIGTVKCGTECGFESTKSIRIAKKVSVYGNQVVQQDLTKILE